MKKRIAKWLAKTALWLDPKSEDVARFYAKQMFDMAVHGGAVTHIDYDKIMLNESPELLK